MMKKSFLTAKRQAQECSHGGTGAVDLYEAWGSSDFKSKIDFIDRVVVPPGSSIGFHKHGENEEMYIILQGSGLMTIEKDEIIVNKGYMILNPAGGRHGPVNHSAGNIDILVIQVGIEASS